MSRVLRTAALLRVSTTRVEQEESPEHQLTYIQEEIRRHTGGDEAWIDSGLVYEDELTGALVLERPGIRQLLADVATGRVDLVLTKSFSRLGRDTLGMLMLKRRLWDDLTVDLVALQDGYRASRDPELIFLVHADRAQHGRLEISRNVRTAMRQKALKGAWTSGMIPFGYQRVSRNELAPHPETAAIAQLIFQLRAEGWGLTAIAGHLNNVLRTPAPQWWFRWELRRERLAELARTDDRWAARLAELRTRFEGRRPLWQTSSIKVILASTAYKGELQYYRHYYRRTSGGRQVQVRRPEEDWIMLPCPPLVEPEVWARAQEVRLRRIGRGIPRERRQYLLSGLVKCGQCGAGMSGTYIKSRGQVWWYYFCQRRRQTKACAAPSVPAGELEADVIAHVRRELARLGELPPPAADNRTDGGARERVRQLEAALADLRDQRRYYRDEHRRHRVSDAELDEELARIATREEELRRLAAAARGELTAGADPGTRRRRQVELARQYQVLDTDDRAAIRRILVESVDRIVVTGQQVQVHLRLPIG